MEENASCKISGIIGITDNGYPIVTSDYVCPHWSEGADGFFMMQECWYCRYADFRKSSRILLQQSICRNPACHIAENIPLKVKNENQDEKF